jgi:MOSC domain-containing protein YiiM
MSRRAFSGEREPKGTTLRNDRQWSGVSIEELEEISRQLDLAETLSAETVGANICVSGIPDFSLLPRGTRLVFPSGAALVIEGYNPPCTDMGEQVVAKYPTRSGDPITPKQWLKPAHGRRGVVGMVDVAGIINSGDEILVQVFETPRIKPY